jgi:hypothetical protein
MPEAPSDPADRRREPRNPAFGRGCFARRDAAPELVPFDVVDTSDSGFRARHRCLQLAAGDVVTFRHGGAAGSARVIWTRVLGMRAETGFLIVGRERGA